MANFIGHWAAWNVAGKSEGDRVTALADGSDASRDMTGSTGPIYRAAAAAFNSKPVLEFDPTDSNDLTKGLKSTTGLDSALDAGDVFLVLVFKAFGSRTPIYETVFAKTGGTVTPLFFIASPTIFSDNNLHNYRGGTDEDAVDAYDGSVHLVTYRYKAGTDTFIVSVDGVQTDTGTRGTVNSATSAAFSLGKLGSEQFPGRMQFAEAALWNHDASSGEELAVVSALATYYGITVAGLTPDTPTSFTATAGTQKVSLAWDDMSGATSYKVYRDGSLLATVSDPTITYIDYTGVVGTAYSYTVSAANGGGESSQTSGLSRTATAPVFDTLDVKISVTGDSVSTLAYLTIGEFEPRLEAKVATRVVTLANSAVSGRTSTTALANIATDYLAARTMGCTHAMVYLGANDCLDPNNIPKATHKANLAAIISGYKDAGIVTILNEVYWIGIDNGVAAVGSDFIPQYHAACAELAAADPTWVKIGDTSAYATFQADLTLYLDPPQYIHPGISTGKDTLAQAWADAVELIIDAPDGPTVPDAPGFTSDNAEPGAGGIQLAPTAPSSNGGSAVLTYSIYRKIVPGSYSLLVTINAADLTDAYLDVTTTVGDDVFYKVLCTNAIGDSAFSTEQEVTSQGPLTPAPTNTGNETDVTGSILYMSTDFPVNVYRPGEFSMSNGFRVISVVGQTFTIRPPVVYGDAPTLSYLGTHTVSSSDPDALMAPFSGHDITNNVAALPDTTSPHILATTNIAVGGLLLNILADSTLTGLNAAIDHGDFTLSTGQAVTETSGTVHCGQVYIGQRVLLTYVNTHRVTDDGGNELQSFVMEIINNSTVQRPHAAPSAALYAGLYRALA